MKFMKQYYYFIAVLFSVCLGRFALAEQTFDGFGQPTTITSLLQDLEMVGSEESQRIFQDAQSTAQQLEETVAQNAADLKHVAQQKTKELQHKAEEESKKIFEQYTKEAVDFTKKVESEAVALKRKAAETVLHLVTKAEEEAAKAKFKARQALLKQKLGDLEKTDFDVSMPATNWKDSIRHDFMHSLQYLHSIIVQGESQQEAQDFTQRFHEQSLWFDKTLAATNQPNDATFFQLEQKNSALKNVVWALQRAESLLLQQMPDLTQESHAYSQMRLMLLYDINAFMQKKSGDGVAAVAETTATEKDIELIVENVVKTSEDKILEWGKHDRALKHEEGPAATATMATTLTDRPAAKLSSDDAALIAQATADQIKKTIAPRFEAFSKDTLELQTIILDTNQKIDFFRQQAQETSKAALEKATAVQSQVSELTTYVQQEARKRADSEAKMQIEHELMGRRFDESAHMFDIRRTLQQESYEAPAAMPMQEQLKEYQGWVDQLPQTFAQKDAPKSHFAMAAKQEEANRNSLESELAQRMLKDQK